MMSRSPNDAREWRAWGWPGGFYSDVRTSRLTVPSPDVGEFVLVFGKCFSVDGGGIDNV